MAPSHAALPGGRRGATVSALRITSSGRAKVASHPHSAGAQKRRAGVAPDYLGGLEEADVVGFLGGEVKIGLWMGAP
jgi:hypothetical protein